MGRMTDEHEFAGNRQHTWQATAPEPAAESVADPEPAAPAVGSQSSGFEVYQQGEAAVPPATFWDSLRRMLFPTRHELRARLMRRIADLDDAIAISPDEAANYVIRGELYLQLGAPDLAAADFRHALTILPHQVEHNRWGVVAQALLDRAAGGLKRAQRRTKA